MNILNKNIRFFLNTVSRPLPLSDLIDATGKNLILPSYHVVSNESLPHIQHLYRYKNEKQFIKDLNFFLKHYEPIDIIQLKKITEDKIIPKKSFFLSFDDGLSEVFHTISPVLKKMGIPAAFFINPSFIDNKNLMYRYKASLIIDKLDKHIPPAATIKKIESIFINHKIPFKNIKYNVLKITYAQQNILDEISTILNLNFNEFLITQKPYLESEQIKDLIKTGFTIGAHSMDHPLYEHISFEDQIRQTKESIHYVKDNFAPHLNTFAFPFTDSGVTKKFFDYIHQINSPLADLSFSGAGIKNEEYKYHLQRIPMERWNFSAASTIKGEYLYYMVKALFGKNRISR